MIPFAMLHISDTYTDTERHKQKTSHAGGLKPAFHFGLGISSRNSLPFFSPIANTYSNDETQMQNEDTHQPSLYVTGDSDMIPSSSAQPFHVSPSQPP